VGQQKPAPSNVPNPGWVFAVNMPSTYPDFAAMSAAGSGIVIELYDPNFSVLYDAAKQWGIPVAVQVNAPPGITPQEYAQRVALAQQYAPNMLVLDIESAGKGYEGSAGWNFSAQVAALIKPLVGDTAVSVTMEPNQADYNYGAFQNLSGAGPTQFWVQMYDGDMNGVADENQALAPAQQAAPGQVIPVYGPNQAPVSGSSGYASYGIPQQGQSVAGVYAAGSTPAGIPAPPGTYTTSPTSTTTAAGGTAHPLNPNLTNKTPDWASAYFGNLGLPADVQKGVNDLFKKYPDQPELAIALARQYIRTTPWFATTFPGFFEGLRAGLFQDETGYRGYVNAANVYTMQYFNRPITTAEVESAMHQGITPEILGRTYEAGAIARAQGPEVLYQLGAFGEEPIANREQTALEFGKQQAGIGSANGSKLISALDRANKRMQSLFQGQLAIPNTAGQALQPSGRDLPA